MAVSTELAGKMLKKMRDITIGVFGQIGGSFVATFTGSTQRDLSCGLRGTTSYRFGGLSTQWELIYGSHHCRRSAPLQFQEWAEGDVGGGKSWVACIIHSYTIRYSLSDGSLNHGGP